MPNILDTIDQITKQMNTPSYPNVSGVTLVEENLSTIVDNLTMKETPIRDRLPRKKGNGLAASWNVLTTIGVGNSAFSQGALPAEDVSAHTRRSALFKEFGKTKSVSDLMINAGSSFTDIESYQLDIAIREVIQDEELFIVNGDSTVNPLEFDGLATTTVGMVVPSVDDAANPAGFRTKLLSKAIADIMTNYGVKPTAIYTSYTMGGAINESLAGDVRVNLNSGGEVATGTKVSQFQGPHGLIPIVLSNAVSTTTNAGVTKGDIYVVTEQARGHEIVYIEEIYGLTKRVIGRVGSAVKFFVAQGITMVNRAPEYHFRIKNVLIPNN